MADKVIYNDEKVQSSIKAIMADLIEQKTQTVNLARIVKEEATATQSRVLEVIAEADTRLAQGMDDVLSNMDVLVLAVRNYAGAVAEYEGDTRGLEV